MIKPYYERTADEFEDIDIVDVSYSKNGLWYACLAGREWYDPDFSTCGSSKEEAIELCAKKIKDDQNGIGKYAPHSCLIKHKYDYRWRIAKAWWIKEVKRTCEKVIYKCSQEKFKEIKNNLIRFIDPCNISPIIGFNGNEYKPIAEDVLGDILYYEFKDEKVNLYFKRAKNQNGRRFNKLCKEMEVFVDMITLGEEILYFGQQ